MKRAMSFRNDELRNRRVLSVLARLFPDVKIRFEVFPRFNINWEGQAYVNIAAKDLTKVFELFPGAEFLPDPET